MTKTSVLDLRNQIIEDLTSSSSEQGMTLHAVNVANKQSRLAVGYSRRNAQDDSYVLELIVPRKKGTAFEEALRIRTRAAGEANIIVMQSAKLPTASQLKTASTYRPFTEHRRPLHLGLSVSNRKSYAGSIGGFVTYDDGKVAVLSASHVLTTGLESPKNQTVYQPGRPDVTNHRAKHEIGLITDYNVITDDNETDYCTAELLKGVEYDGNIIPKGFKFPDEGRTIVGLTDWEDTFDPPRKVAKVGRSTGHTIGTLRSVGVNFVLFGSGDERYLYKNLLVIEWTNKTPFSDHGDSGSMIYDVESCTALGILIGGFSKCELIDSRNMEVSFAVPLDTVLTDTEASWL